jgi:flagellar biosynthetic protein FlhB
MVQVGMLASSKTIRPDFGRIGLGRGMGRLFSGRSLVRGAMACAKVAVVVGIAFWAFGPALPRIASCGARSAAGLAAEVGSLAGDLAMRILPALAGLAVLDWLYQRWRHRRDLMMTPREVREDMRRAEGDPLIRTHRRRLARKQMRGGSDS